MGSATPQQQPPQPQPQPQPSQSQQPQPQPQPQSQQPQQNTAMAVIAYILFFVPLLTDAKNDPFVKFHVKQSLVLLLSWFLAAIISSISVGIIGWIGWVLNISILILWVMGIINAVNGKQEHLPIIGKYGDKFNF